MTTQNLLEEEEEKYLTVNLLVPCISDLRDGLNYELADSRLPSPADGLVEIAARNMISVRGGTC